MTPSDRPGPVTLLSPRLCEGLSAQLAIVPAPLWPGRRRDRRRLEDLLVAKCWPRCLGASLLSEHLCK